MVHGGSERKRRWKENKRLQGWAWSQIQGPRHGVRFACSSESISSSRWSGSNDSEDSSLVSGRSVNNKPLIQIASPIRKSDTLNRLRSKLNLSDKIHSTLSRLCKAALHSEFLVLDETTLWRIVTIKRTLEDVLSQKVADDLLKRGFLTLHPDFIDRMGDRHFSENETSKMMRAGEPYFTPSGWSRVGLRVDNMAQYSSYAVAFSGRPVGGIFSLIKLGILVLGEVVADGRVLLTQLVFPTSQTDSISNKAGADDVPTPETQLFSDASQSVDISPASFSAQTTDVPDPAPDTRLEVSMQSSSLSPGSSLVSPGYRRERCHRALTYAQHIQFFREELYNVELSPSIHYAALASKPHTLKWSYVQFVLQVLVEPSSVSRYPGSLHTNVWPDELRFDSNYLDSELDWRLNDQTKVIPAGLLFFEMFSHPLDLCRERQREASTEMILRQCSGDRLWLFDPSVGQQSCCWQPFPTEIQEKLNQSWKNNDVVSPPFTMNIDMSTGSADGPPSLTYGGDSQDWEVLFSMPVVRKVLNRNIWCPVSSMNLTAS